MSINMSEDKDNTFEQVTPVSYWNSPCAHITNVQAEQDNFLLTHDTDYMCIDKS